MLSSLSLQARCTWMQGTLCKIAVTIAGMNSRSRCMLTLANLFHPFKKKLPINCYSSSCNIATLSKDQSKTNQVQADNHKNKNFQAVSPSPAFNLKAYMHEKVNAVNKALEEAVLIKEPKKLYEAMRYTLLGGNKISAISCIAACELVGGQESTVMPTVCAVQMMDASCLIHDDLPYIDNDDLRNGKPSNHKVYGEATALLAGDALCTLAFQHMATATKGVSKERLLWAMAELAKSVGLGGFTCGQILDVCSKNISNVTLEHLESIHLPKAAAIGDGFLCAGAIIGGATDEEVGKVKMFGRCTGLLYQLVDEILDFTKDSMTDRLTYPKLIGIEKSKELAVKLDREAEDCLAGFDPKNSGPLISLKNIYRENYLS